MQVRLEVLESAETKMLTTIDRIKMELGVEELSVQKEEYYKALIEETSEIIEDYCDRVFAKQKYREYRYGEGQHEMIFRHWPVSVVHKAAYKTADSLWELSEYDYVTLDSQAGILIKSVPWYDTRYRYQNIRPWPKDQGFYWWVFEYTAGYELPEQPDNNGNNNDSDLISVSAPRLPRAIERACIEFVKFKIQTAMHPSGVVRDRMGQSERQFNTSDGLKTDMPDAVERYLKPYVRTVIA